ncbi:uncharacterized protein [Prorops nasuta]|uniref:uncharacterized protein n=1 Tax=Prorops nasuta TaxID=863751 RepID=UPI0034CE9ACF
MLKIFTILFLALNAAASGIPASKRDRLVGHDLAEPNEFPFMAAIMVKHNETVPKDCELEPSKCTSKPSNASYYFHCNGVIIGPQFVITNSFCAMMEKFELYNVRIRTGTNSLLDNQGEMHEIEGYKVNHKIYSYRYGIFVRSTVAIYKLKKPMKVNNRQRPVHFSAIFDKSFNQDTGNVGYATVVGWGYLNSEPELKTVFPKLLKLPQKVIIESNPQCKRLLNARYKPNDDADICVYTSDRPINDGAALIFKKSFIGTAYDSFDFRNAQGIWNTGTLFAYNYNIREFIYNTATDYY